MRGFEPIIWAGLSATAALSCYLVSLQVASERAKLEQVEHEIALTTREIRSLETEIGTRGRLDQLERWNVNFLRLSAPRADQFMEGSFQLATLMRPEPAPAIEAPVILAAAPNTELDDEVEAVAGDQPKQPLGELVHQASLRTDGAGEKRVARDPLAPLPAPARSSTKAGPKDNDSNR